MENKANYATELNFSAKLSFCEFIIDKGKSELFSKKISRSVFIKNCPKFQRFDSRSSWNLVD